MKSITLIGHSGIGKTTLADKLTAGGWFHYSGDYRIATRYLNEELDDWLNDICSSISFIENLQKLDAVSIKAKVSIESILILSAYIGKLGKQGLSEAEFFRRQKLFAQAEKMAMYDLEKFRKKALVYYGKDKFINDAGGSLGEYINDIKLMEYIASQSLIVYLKADSDLHREIENRAQKYPKPICYDEDFLRSKIKQYSQEFGFTSADEFDCDDFLRFVISDFFEHRSQRYLTISQKYGLVLDVKEVWDCRDNKDFEDLLDREIMQQAPNYSLYVK